MSISNIHAAGYPDKIFLNGFMGSGKSYWGKIWALQYGYFFYDLDEVIETNEGKSISYIFENEGEEYFRKVETVALQNFAQKNNCIIACGGGAACFNDNMDWMNSHGATVYLEASATYILSRVKDEKSKRPLINKLNEAELIFFIEQKLKQRVPFYNQAQLIVDAESLDSNSLSFFNLKS